MPVWLLVLIVAPSAGVAVDLGRSDLIPVEILVDVPGEQEVGVLLEVSPIGGAVDLPESRTVEVQAPDVAAIPLERGILWRVQPRADGFWSPPILVEAFGGRAEAHVSLFPTGVLEARLKLPNEKTDLSGVSVAFQAAPNEEHPLLKEQHQAPCEVVDQELRCTLPAASLDLRFAVDGFVPVYRWGVDVPERRSALSDPIELTRGGSLSGWIERADGAMVRPAQVDVELVPMAGGEAPDHSRARLLRWQARPNERGFFQVSGLPGGSYRLTVKHARLAPATLEALRVAEASETHLEEPVVLYAPLQIAVDLLPPVDPGGEPWRIYLWRPDPAGIETGADKIAQDQPVPDGRFVQAGLPPGTYWLIVKDSNGSNLAWETLDLQPGSTTFEVALDLAPIEGTVTLGGEPLAARLWWGGRSSPVSVRMESDAEGWFSGSLPRTGTWSVDVAVADPPLVRELEDVEVEGGSPGEPVYVEIELPAGEVEGVVVDAEGKTLSDAIVALMGQDTGELLERRVDEHTGEFRFAGLEPGPYAVRARGQRLISEGERATRITSGTVEVVIRDESHEEAVRLVAVEGQPFRGMVASLEGALPGARVVAFSRGAGGYLSVDSEEAITDVGGTFELTLAADAIEAHLLVLAPGFELRSMLVPLPWTDPLTVGMREPSSALSIDGIELGRRKRSQPHPVVFLDQLPLDLSMLVHWAQLNGVAPQEPLFIPAMPAGSYSVCEAPNLASLIRLGGETEPADRSRLRCDQGRLSPYGVLTLSVPTSQSAKAPRRSSRR